MIDVIKLSDEEVKKLSSEELISRFKSNREKGLSKEEVISRLKVYGPNSLQEKKKSLFKKFFGFFWGPIPWMIEIAAILSISLAYWDEFSIIMILLMINALIGFWEEHKAENALDALKKGLALQAKVLREGAWIVINASELVPGDIIRVRLGDIVPADAKLLQGDYLNIDQSALTGESLPVTKKVDDAAYSGSIVKKGEMQALVVGTGENTFFGRTAKLVATAGAVSHFQRAVMRIGDFLIVIALALSILLIFVELSRSINPLKVFQFVLILVIASIPVAMPAVLSVTMALGALVLSKKKAIVSRLQAIEELAGVDILCSDKTGTLTQNKLTLDVPILFGAKTNEECIMTAVLASKEEDQDPIDLAIINYFKGKGSLENYKQIKFSPFDPVSKRTEAVVIDPSGKQWRYTKGAPQIIIGLCTLSDEDKSRAEKSVNELAAKGYRTLGVARAENEGAWQFLGLLPLMDPPREDSKQTIADAEKMGIDVKMVTGDNIGIAKEISRQLGLGLKINKASDFFEKGTKIDLSKTKEIEESDGFAEVFPEHKYGIVKALQTEKHIVMMTGDGVNDAPALRQADAGIAVSGATDAARAAAALILSAPGLSVIITAIKEARRIFERMLSYTIYRIAMTYDIMLFVVLAMLIFPTVGKVSYQPLTPFMIVLLALLDDIPIMTIAYDNTLIPPKPVRWKMGWLLSISSLLGTLALLQTFGLFLIGIRWIYSPDWQNWMVMDPSHLQTIVFLQLVVGGHLLLFLTRTRGYFFKPPYPSLPLFSAIVITQIVAILICYFGFFVPKISLTFIGLIWAYNIIWMFVQDIVKVLAYKVMDFRAKHHEQFFEKMQKELHPYNSYSVKQKGT